MVTLYKAVIRKLCAAFALVMFAVIAVPASAEGPADKALRLNFASVEQVDAVAYWAEPENYVNPVSGPRAGSLQIGNSFGYGFHRPVYRAYYFDNTPTATPSVGLLFGLTTLDPYTTIFDTSDKSALHLVVAFDTDFAFSSVIGQEFTDAFGGFTDTYSDYNGFEFFNGVTEEDFIDELLYIAGLDQQYGLRASAYDGPQSNLLFDFGHYISQSGGALEKSQLMTLVAFSAGKVIGEGEVEAITPPGGAVPEPTTWAMMIGGFGMVGGSMRYRRRKTTVNFA